MNIQSFIKELAVIREALKEGILNAKLSKAGKENVVNDLKEVIALAEKIKADLEKES